jgi:acyl-CoA reductase-like NAD-dependent aldehyde dehydrogenase
MKEEVLGPVLVICPAEENEILEIANNNYGFN